MKIRPFFSLIFIIIVSTYVLGCVEKKDTYQTDQERSDLGKVITPQQRFSLWNGKDFTGWKLFIPDDSVDVSTVWMVKDGVIHCTGIPNGYLRTEQDYKDYQLDLEWRWVAEPGNSGVLLHMSEPDEVWPKSIEGQLMSGNAGDIWLIGGTEVKEHVDKSTRRVAKREESSEKPAGEWNKYEIICAGNTIKLYVNGVLQNEASETSVQSGKICLQSEGKPIEFRNIFLQQVD
jgi:hypothetical protein